MTEFRLTPENKSWALSSLQELHGEWVYIVSKATSQPIKMNPGVSTRHMGRRERGGGHRGTHLLFKEV